MRWGVHYFTLEQLSEYRHKIIDAKRYMDNSSDKSGLAEQLFIEHIKPILDIYQPVVSSLADHHGGAVYRARKCINLVPFKKIEELYNPPVPSGRAYTNLNEPLLYASSSIQTALSEIEAKIGDLVNVVRFDYTKIQNGKFWFVGQMAEHFRSNETSRYLNDPRGVLKFLYHEPYVRNSVAYKDSLINEIFSVVSTKTDEYSLNKLMIKAIKEKEGFSENFSGVVFRSVKDSPGLNFAICGDFIKILEPRIVHLMKITAIDDYGSIAYKILGQSESRDSILNWEHINV